VTNDSAGGPFGDHPPLLFSPFTKRRGVGECSVGVSTMMAPQDLSEPTTQPPAPQRRRYRVPVGMPGKKPDWRTGSAVSIAAHILLLILLVGRLTSPEIFEMAQGAGGDGPAGGGGGGTRGSGRVREQLKFIQVAP